MNTADHDTGVYVFQQTKCEQLVRNNFDKFGFSVLLLVSIYVFIHYEVTAFRVIFYGSITLVPLLVGQFMKLFAYKITIDFKSQVVSFDMLKGMNPIVVPFYDVKDITFNGYTFFSLNERMVFSFESSMEFLTTIRKIRRIHWGSLCFIYGPTKKVRDSISD